jgi:hypothetical protein
MKGGGEGRTMITEVLSNMNCGKENMAAIIYTSNHMHMKNVKIILLSIAKCRNKLRWYGDETTSP